MIFLNTIKMITISVLILIFHVISNATPLLQRGTGNIEITVFFETGHSKLGENSFQYKRLITFLDSISIIRNDRQTFFSITGNASFTGSMKYNDRLSLKRAFSVQKMIKKYLFYSSPAFKKIEGRGYKDNLNTRNLSDLSKFQNTRIIVSFERGKTEPDEILSSFDTIKRYGKNSIDMTFVYIKSGEFRMGSSLKDRDEDEEIKNINIKNDFFIQNTEVTQKQWSRVMGKNPSSFSRCGENCPVENITWDDAHIFIRKLNGLEKTTIYSLPSEEQWEFAIKRNSKKDTIQIFDNPYDFAWINLNSKGKTHRVATKKPEDNGLYDMRGNVWEWCTNQYLFESLNSDFNYYKGKKYRVIRGGNWNSDIPDIRSSNRLFADQRRSNAGIGFRVVALKK
ncbi:MAG: SUMF1/EgtB/PvdO family nonheme iron enzyme [Desulfobacterales bacterium]|nr:SUMF1/EgtB/PvdO family nonheme iron enzyme [Desulfobacterales bacterium]